MLEQSQIMEYSDYQLHFIKILDRNLERAPSRMLFEEIEILVNNLDLDEPIHPTITETWDKCKEEARPLYTSEEFKKIDERLQQSKKIDKSVFELDFKPDSKITFLLGAGSSAPSGIPTVNTLLTSLWDKAKKLNRDDVDELAKFCGKNGIKNIEDLLTAAYLSNFAAKKNSVISLLNYFLFSDKTRGDGFFRKRRMSYDVDASSISFLQETLQILFSLLTSTMITANPNPAHDAIAQFADKYKKTAIITTNYDCCIDEALLSNNLQIQKSIDSDVSKNSHPGIELVKMHGSINWAYCESCQYTREFDFSKMKETYVDDSASYPVIGICTNCTGQRRPLLVPPLSFKFMMFPSLIQLWNSARKNIEAAEYLIVVGYSFSDADNYITKIVSLSMSRNSNQKMIVVTTDHRLVESLRNKFSVSIENFDKSRIIEVCESCDVILPKILNQSNTPTE